MELKYLAQAIKDLSDEEIQEINSMLKRFGITINKNTRWYK